MADDARRQIPMQLVRHREHYDLLVDKWIRNARVSVWIATANVKDVHIEAPIGTRARARGRYASIIEMFSDLTRRGVEVKVLHGAVPSRRFQQRLAGSDLGGDFEMRCCPRLYLKMIAVDGQQLYLGSANLTGAGLGAKGDGRRNFEVGIATDDDILLDEMQEEFMQIWSGGRCGPCKLRKHCPEPLDG